MEIREIEKIIDEAHKTHEVFKSPKNQAMHDVLASFEDMCSLTLMGSVLNPLGLKGIVDQMDALNMAFSWIDQLCPKDTEGDIEMEISENRYAQCCNLLNQYAYPYSVICSGYISYSRKRFNATVESNCITFDFGTEQNKSAWNDILREGASNDFQSLSVLINPMALIKASAELRKHISVENGMICYSLTEEILDAFRKIARTQWDYTKTLPDTREFDLFTMDEYKKFWVAMTTLCYIHFCSCFSIEDPLIRLRNSIIVQSKKCIVDYICSETALNENKVEAVLKYITYSSNRKNIDIMYQPIVEITDDILLIAPVLFMGSRPERNLLAVVSANHDSKYSKEVNELEGLMVSELEGMINSKDIENIGI